MESHGEQLTQQKKILELTPGELVEEKAIMSGSYPQKDVFNESR